MKKKLNKIINDLSQNDYRVEKVKKGSRAKNPLPPFTTIHFNKKHLKKLNFITKKNYVYSTSSL